MKKQWMIAALIMACVAGPVMAQTTEAVSENDRRAALDPNAPATTADQRLPVSVRQLSAIEFGTFSSEASGGAITVSPTGARSASGSIVPVGFTATGPAEFELTGQPGAVVTITLPERVSLGRNGSGAGAEITNLNMMPKDGVTLGDNGKARVRVGGTLRLPPRTTPGSYSGIFNIDARYLQ